MYVTQQIVPRCKEWVPLATNQLRLRNLIQVLAFCIKRNEKNAATIKETKSLDDHQSCESYYYTLHSTTMSAPFYTSEKVRNDSPKWREIEVSSFLGNVSNSADAFVIRLWSTRNVLLENEAEDEVISIWGVYLNGLTYLGPNLGSDISLKPNSIVFLMPGGYFTDVKCVECKPKIRYVSVVVNQSDVQHSYTVNTLTRLHTIQQVIKKELAEVDILKQKISVGDFFRNENRGRTMLRRLLSKNKPRISHQDYIKMKENIEIAKYRVHVLREEKSVLSTRLKEIKTRIENLSDDNQLLESKIMENYRVLMKESQVQRELRRDHISKREIQLHSKAKLNFRAQQLISELDLIYPIVEKHPEKFTICGVHLPDSEDFAGHNDIQISAALGFVAHVLQMISVFLQVPLRYPVIHLGSESRIIDHISEKIPDPEREFPLYMRGKEKLQFHYAVYLLNKNIAQLRWLCGLPTLDLRNTLSNLSTLVKMRSENSELQQGNRSLSSSTADVSNLHLSMSSPVGSVMSLLNKKNGKNRGVSESYVDTGKKENYDSFKHSMGHRISKSAGSAKDIMIRAFPVKNQNGQCSILSTDRVGIGNNFSYSLDKGLNEYREVSTSVIKPINNNETNSFLNCAASMQNPIDNHKSKEKDRFLKSWEAEGHSIPFSDDDSDMNTSDFSCSKMSQFRLETTQEINAEVEITDCGTESSAIKRESSELNLSEILCDCLPDNAQGNEPGINDGLSGEIVKEKLICDATALTDGEMKQYNEGSSLIVTDSILESVTSRTEALVNQSTSFNRFRNRLKSTLENST